MIDLDRGVALGPLDLSPEYGLDFSTPFASTQPLVPGFV
jgi:hypothetical protein